jgi:hypothetical protein
MSSRCSATSRKKTAAIAAKRRLPADESAPRTNLHPKRAPLSWVRSSLRSLRSNDYNKPQYHLKTASPHSKISNEANARKVPNGI